MKYVVMGLGTAGDINPLLGLASELKNRGNSVVFLTNTFFKEVVERLGITFESVGSIDAHIIAWEKNQGGPVAFQHYQAPSFSPSFLYVENVAKSEKIVVLTLNHEYGAAVAAKKYHIPCVKIILSPNAIFSAEKLPAPICWRWPAKLPIFLRRFLFDRAKRVQFRQFVRRADVQDYLATRVALGCPLVYSDENQFDLQIGLFPEWFGKKPKDWPENLVLTNFPLFDPEHNEFNSDCVIDYVRKGAAIIFTAGSSITDATEMFTVGRQVCEALKVRGLFVGGGLGRQSVDGSPYCRHVDYVDFESVLPYAKLLVHHGGIGTMSQAIRAGVPQLIRPIKFDQPDNAYRIKLLGLGTYILPNEFQFQIVLSAIKELIGSGGINKSLQFFSSEIRKENGIQVAVDLIQPL